MRRILLAVCLTVITVVFCGFAGAQNCGPCQQDSDCGSGQSCCYTQYSNGSISCNFCKAGSCYTTSTKKKLIRDKELEAASLKTTNTAKTVDMANPADTTKMSETNARNCGSCQVNSNCGAGNSCCYHQDQFGHISCNFCKPGSCFTTSTKKNLTDARELDADTLKK
jgi:hypothetical protein